MQDPDKLLEQIASGLNQKSSDRDYQIHLLEQTAQINAIINTIKEDIKIKEYFELAEQYAKVGKIAFESGELEKSKYFKNEAINILIVGMKRLGYKIERAT